jgi:hypothetical protein
MVKRSQGDSTFGSIFLGSFASVALKLTRSCVSCKSCTCCSTKASTKWYETGILEITPACKDRSMQELGIARKNRRQHERLPYYGSARISWEDEQGLVRFAHAKCLDISEDGLQIEVAETIPVRSRLLLRADRLNFSGSGTVRNVAWRGCKYILGLSLSQNQSLDSLAMIRISAMNAPMEVERTSSPSASRAISSDRREYGPHS